MLQCNMKKDVKNEILIIGLSKVNKEVIDYYAHLHGMNEVPV